MDNSKSKRRNVRAPLLHVKDKAETSQKVGGPNQGPSGSGARLPKYFSRPGIIATFPSHASTMADCAKKKHIAFFHPDLGIGGAERLIIDAAVGLQNRGHKVVIFTSHCDPQHCFDEARDGNTR